MLASCADHIALLAIPHTAPATPLPISSDVKITTGMGPPQQVPSYWHRYTYSSLTGAEPCWLYTQTMSMHYAPGMQKSRFLNTTASLPPSSAGGQW